MSEVKVEIEVRARRQKNPWRYDAAYSGKARVYFFHEGESILEGFGNRVARPADLYRTYLPQVAEAMGLPRTTKFKWSQKAGCRCGCSPGFICGDAFAKDVFVTLSKEAPKTNDNPEDLIKGTDRVMQLVNQLSAEGMLKPKEPVQLDLFKG